MRERKTSGTRASAVRIPRATGLVLISRANASQGSADFLIAEPLFAGVIQSAMVGEYQVRA